MKRNLIYSVFAALLLVSCSGNEDIPEPTPAPVPETLDAYLSLALSNGTVKTKAATRADVSNGETGENEPSYGDGSGSNVDPAGTTAINTLTVVIFRGKPTAQAATEEGAGEVTIPASQPEGSLAYFNTFKTDETIGDRTADANKLCKSNIVKFEGGLEYQINGIKVKAGNLHVLIMANMPERLTKQITSTTKKSDLEKMVYGDLANEGFNKIAAEEETPSFPCSMTSKWIDVTIEAKDNNEVYYLLSSGGKKATETTVNGGGVTTDADRTFESVASNADPIPLYRNVSAVAFKKITLDPSDGWGKTNGATLTLKAIFITNAVNRTSMTIGTPMVAKVTEPKNESDLYYGGYSFNDKDGKTQNYRGSGTNAVLASVKNNAGLPCLYKVWSSDNPAIVFTGNTSAVSLPKNSSDCVGKYFMLYENSAAMKAGDGKHTLITLYADYLYKDNLGVEHTVKDCFYTVVVNDENNTGNGGAGYGTYVGRNYIYNVNLTIVGPGSKNPFVPLYTANATAFVEAADWTDAVDIDQDAE